MALRPTLSVSSSRGSCPFCAVVRVSGGGARAESPLDADVCGQCGHVQLFATRPEALWRAYERGGRQP